MNAGPIVRTTLTAIWAILFVAPTDLLFGADAETKINMQPGEYDTVSE